MPGGGRGGSRAQPAEAVRETEEWKEKRKRNNDAVHRTREKKRNEESEIADRVTQLRQENTGLERRVESLNKELSFLKEMFVAYAAGGGGAGRKRKGKSAEIPDGVDDTDEQQPRTVKPKQAEHSTAANRLLPATAKRRKK